MKHYQVLLMLPTYFSVEVDAESEELAATQAYDIYSSGRAEYVDHGDIEVDSVEEVGDDEW